MYSLASYRRAECAAFMARAIIRDLNMPGLHILLLHVSFQSLHYIYYARVTFVDMEFIVKLLRFEAGLSQHLS